MSINTVPAAARIVATNEKITGPPGAEMLRRSEITNESKSEPLEIIDNACGGGILTSEVLTLAKQHPQSINVKRIIASDDDEKMLSYIGQRSKDSGWRNVEIRHFNQVSLPLPDNTFTYNFNNFGIFFCAEDDKVLSETYRTLRPGGVAGFTSWKSIAWVPTVAVPAIKTFIPDAPALPSLTHIFPAQGWNDLPAIRAKLEKAGFRDIHVNEYAFTPDVEAEEFAEATALLVKVMTRRFWNQKEHAKFESQIEPALLKYLQENFSDGKWDGQMVAIISTGKK